MKKILVTGGAGFIGSHLCEFLLKNNKNFVYCVDNLITGNKNISNFYKNKNFQFINEDICKISNLEVSQIYNCMSKDPPSNIKNIQLKPLMHVLMDPENFLILLKEIMLQYCSHLQVKFTEIHLSIHKVNLILVMLI